MHPARLRLAARAPRAAALVAALACGPGIGGEAPPETAASDLEADLSVARLEIATLREALAEERADRLALELESERLREELAALGWADARPSAGAEPRPEGASGAGEARATEGAGDAPARPWFDADALLAQGEQPAEVERLREAFATSELAMLELENRAQREGWFDEPRYREELRDMRLALRAELGDELFDRLLYATGRDNRVVVSDLLEGSAAQRAGLAPGDEILSYAEERVFRAMELKQATTEGRLGERVAVEVLRDGARVRVWVPRGPLGIQLRQARRPPPW